MSHTPSRTLFHALSHNLSQRVKKLWHVADPSLIGKRLYQRTLCFQKFKVNTGPRLWSFELVTGGFRSRSAVILGFEALALELCILSL